MILTAFLAIWGLTATSLTYAQGGTSNKPIRLVSGNYYPEIIPLGQTRYAQDDVFDGRYFKLIQFIQIPNNIERKSWQDEGLYLVDYLHDDTYFAVIDQDFDLNRLSSSIITIIDVHDMFKKEAAFALQADTVSTNKFVVSYYATLDATKVISDLESRGVVIENHRDYSRQLEIIVSPARIDEITVLPYVQFIEAALPEPELEAYYKNSTGRANYLITGYNGLTYNGDGVVIAIGEGNTAGNHIDFRGRLTELSSGDSGSHKIGSMRNAGGGGNYDPTEMNNAAGAMLLSVGGGPDYAALYDSHNLRFTNHSYGYGVGGGYNSAARNHDLRTASHPYHIISYSSGNDGGSTGYAPYDGFSGWANVTGAVKQNKNHFAIRNLGGDDAILTWGSKGPAYDGRILPQLTIEGWEGTSYASPKVVGLMAVLAQVYKDKNGGAEAPANLLRAVLMNTADDMDDPGPDFKTGYGRPNARRAYHVLDNSQFLSSTISNGVIHTHTLNVPANTTQVRVMLMWPDVAASVSADPAIVNNLNLLVTDPPSTTNYNPWVLDHTPNPINLDLPATRQVDNLNTMEQVTVDNPASGNWTIAVNGASVPQGPQTYHVVYEFLMDELYMGFPLQDVRLEPENTYHLKWDSYGGSETFTLTYQLDGGSWVDIVTGHDASSRSYEWTAPPVAAGIHTIKIQVQRGVFTATSETNYIGEVPQSLAVDWACTDTVKLSWNNVNGATGYNVYRLGTKYMKQVTTSITFDGTSAILTGLSTIEDEHFAVSAVTGANEGLRTNALTKVAGDYNCFNAKTTTASEVDKSDIVLHGLTNPHNATLTNVHFEYGPTTAYGSSTPNISTSATGHTQEAVTSTIVSTLTSRFDSFHYRLVLQKDGGDVYGDDQEIRLAPGNDFTFDGTDDHLNLGNADQVTGANPRTVAAWALTESFNNGGIFQAGADGTDGADFSLRTLTTDERWRVQLWGASEFDVTLSGSKDAWHHYALTYDGTDVTLYYDGNLAGSSTVALNTLAHDVYVGRWRDDYFDGRIDETSYWDKALTEAEIRDLMHQPLDGNEANLINYYNMDGRSGAAFDVVTGKEAQISGGTSKTTGTIPFGLGTEFTASEANGEVTFTGTDLAANYDSHNGATVIVSKIEIEPNVTDGFPGSSTVFDNQYWVAHRHGSGSFSAVVTFTISKDLTAADQNTPGQIHLYSRDKGSDGNWSFVTMANSVDAASDQAVFNDITTFDQQFILSRNTDPFLNATENTLPFRNIKVDCSYQQYDYQLSGINLTGNVTVTPPAGFLVSTNASSGFSPTLSLIPVSETVSETIYVRHTPSSTGTFAGGDVLNSSDGAATVNVNIPQFETLDVADYATQSMTFDGSNDYLDVQDFDWNPNNVFSVEWWLKPNTHANWNQQVGNGWGNFLFHTNSSGMLSAGVANNGWSRINSASGALDLDEWQHFAFILDGSNAKFYRNGVLVGEKTGSDGVNSNWGHFEIGKSGSSTINGQIDEFRIWSTPRTQQEIRDNMHNVLAGSETGLELYLQFNAETGEVVDFSDGCYTVDSYNGPGRTTSTASVGTVGEFVITQTSTSVGDPGKQMTVTITSTPSITDYLGIYRTGSGTQHHYSDTLPTGITWRSDIFWGIQEYGDVTATLVIDYGDVGGVYDPSAIKLLKRADVVNNWTDVSGEFVHNEIARIFSKTGATDFSEFSIGGSPTAIDDVYNMLMNDVLNVPPNGVLDNDADIKGGTTAITDTPPVTGTLVFTDDGSFNYTPPMGYAGLVTFTYHARDGAIDSNIASVTITVNAVPIANEDAYTTTENITLTITAPGVLENDVDTDPLTATLDTDVTNGTLALASDGGFVYTPTLDFCGTDSFIYHANDGIDHSNNTTVTLHTTCIHTLTVNLIGSGPITPTAGTHDHISGTLVSLSATPDPGWQFDGWSGDATGSTPPPLLMDRPRVVTATFSQIPTYTLTVDTAGDGSGSVDLDPGGPIYDEGTVVTMTANAAHGSYFAGWTGDVESANSTETITMDSDKVVTATFSVTPPVTYSLTIDVLGSGTVTPTAGTHNYISGTIVSLAAAADSGWTFNGWSGDAGGSNPTTTVTMTGNRSITATFTQDEYVLDVRVSPVGGGTVMSDPVQSTYHYGQVVALTAAATEGWQFDDWSGDATGTTTTVSLLMDSHRVVTATFSQTPTPTYTLTINTAGDGSGIAAADPNQTIFDHGDVVTLTATPDTDSDFVGWTGDVVTTTTPITLLMTADTSLTATFDLLTLTLSLTTAGDGSGTVMADPNQTVFNYGSVVTVTAMPDTGSDFVGWTGNMVTTTNPIMLLITTDTSLTATFDKLHSCYLPIMLKQN
ncbi:MAG: hypothetical protein GY832_29210 [Chloroflexi bacterium]|nr:hypothetical protein [Chloroflexota bacterium]